jgi:hypothetical protein
MMIEYTGMLLRNAMNGKAYTVICLWHNTHKQVLSGGDAVTRTTHVGMYLRDNVEPPACTIVECIQQRLASGEYQSSTSKVAK